MSEIKITSLVGYATGAALIQLEWGAQKGQLTAAEARAHALRVLECAEAAETDLFLVTFLTEKIGAPLSAAVQVLQEFRRSRERQQGAPGGGATEANDG